MLTTRPAGATGEGTEPGARPGKVQAVLLRLGALPRAGPPRLKGGNLLAEAQSDEELVAKLSDDALRALIATTPIGDPLLVLALGEAERRNLDE